MMTIQLLLNAFLATVVGGAIVCDLRTRRIPNRLVLLGIVGGVSLNALGGASAVVNSLVGLALAIGLGFVPFALGWLGAGDVKLLGSVGAIVGVDKVMEVVLFTAITGALIALVALLVRRGRGFRAFKKEVFTDLQTLVLTQGRVLPEGVGARASKGAATIPYGVAIGVGSMVAVAADASMLWVIH